MIDPAGLTPAHWIMIRVVRALDAAAAAGDANAALDAIEALCIIRGDIAGWYSPDNQSRLGHLLAKIRTATTRD